MEETSLLPWSVLNEFPLDDLFRYCQTNVPASKLCEDSSYFQQRLIAKGGTAQNYQNNPFIEPIKKYVHALVQSRNVNNDPGATVYMTAERSDILFPGLEYFIGLSKMGIRAIGQNSESFLIYVLKKYPSLSEQNEILGELHLKYARGELSNAFLSNMIMSLLYRPYRNTSNIYPIMPDPYLIGVRGEYLNPSHMVIVLPYYYGLIDGGHLTVLTKALRTQSGISPSKKSEIKIILLQYIIRTNKPLSTFTHLLRDIDQASLGHLYEYAVENDNLDITRYLLSVNQNLANFTVYPGSVEMFNLLNRYLSVPETYALAGAIKSGNYKLWNLITNNGQRVSKLDPSRSGNPQEFYRKVIRDTPPYMLQMYIRGAKTSSQEVDQMMIVFLENEDFLRLEVSLNLKPMDAELLDVLSQAQSFFSEIGGGLEEASHRFARNLTFAFPSKADVEILLRNPMIEVFGLDLSPYPKINQILSS